MMRWITVIIPVVIAIVIFVGTISWWLIG